MLTSLKDLPSNCDGYKTLYLHHGLTCKNGGLLVARHNGVRNTLVSLAMHTTRGAEQTNHSNYAPPASIFSPVGASLMGETVDVEVTWPPPLSPLPSMTIRSTKMENSSTMGIYWSMMVFKVVLLLMVTVCTFVLIFNSRATVFLRNKHLKHKISF